MPLRRRARVLLLVAALVVVGLPATAAAAPNPLVVTTDKGAVQGASAGGVDRFLGIPYAAPPVGGLRWQPPAPAARWDGVRPAVAYGARCTAVASDYGPRSEAEDCLFVNVQRPAGTTATTRLPVYVFLHVGGLLLGGSDQADGTKIVRETNAIVVTMNYRLGLFGFLGLPGLSDRGEGNYGFLDQQASLRWVQRNIAAFGGDSSRVTLGGGSASGFAVCGHMVAAGSRGLFSRAMIQSGSCDSRPVAATEAASRAFATVAGCTTADPRCLRRQSAGALLDAGAAFEPALTDGVAPFPLPTQTSLERGDIARVPMVIGANRDEGRTFAAGLIGASQADYVAAVEASFGADASTVLARYPWPATADQFTAAYLLGAVYTDSGVVSGIGGCAALATTQAFAARVPVWSYEFDHRDGPGIAPVPGYVWGAGHAAELAYLFPAFDNGTPIAPTFDAGERQLARDMVQYWGAFVFSGVPQAQGRATWPPFGTSASLLSLRSGGATTTISVAAYRAEHQCDFWGTLGQA